MTSPYRIAQLDGFSFAWHCSKCHTLIAPPNTSCDDGDCPKCGRIGYLKDAITAQELATLKAKDDAEMAEWIGLNS